MIYHAAANFIVLVYFSFFFFAAGGALLAFRWKQVIWSHLPAALWAILMETTGWICSLRPLENWLRQKGGMQGYKSGFIEHYVSSLLYLENLTRSFQFVFAGVVLAVNLAIYAWLFRARMKV